MDGAHDAQEYPEFRVEANNDQLPVGLSAQLVRALHRHRRGQGFESRTSLNFSGFLFATAKVASITAMISFTFNIFQFLTWVHFNTEKYRA